MSKLLARLERLESGTRLAFDTVCSHCRAEGLTSTPYEHCKAKRCDEGKRAWADTVAAHPDLPGRMLREWEIACRMDDQDPAEEMQKIEAEDRAKREAWEARKQEARKCAIT